MRCYCADGDAGVCQRHHIAEQKIIQPAGRERAASGCTPRSRPPAEAIQAGALCSILRIWSLTPISSMPAGEQQRHKADVIQRDAE